jgi:hypothetical protein
MIYPQPQRVRLADDNGLITREWLRYLESLQASIPAATDLTGIQAQIVALQAAIAALTATVAAIGSGPVGPILVGGKGPPGDDGTIGDDGAPGPPGPAGPAGPPGPPGSGGGAASGVAFVIEGEPGEDGMVGPRGAPGAAGTAGVQGPQGPVFFFEPEPGEDGMIGPRGPTGPQGPAGAGGSGAAGLTTINFGAFPGASDASVTITGQAGIVAGSVVDAWLVALDTVDHLADEHWLESIRITAGNIVPGVGFTIYASNTSTLNEPSPNPRLARFAGTGQDFGAGQQDQQNNAVNLGTRIYGQWSVAWSWV